MGLLDGLLGSVLGQVMGGGQGGPGGMQAGYGGMPGGASSVNPMLQMVLQMIQQQGGLGGLLQQFEQAGHGGAAQSWLTPGATNQPINADILQQVLGSGALSQIAEQFGMSHQEVASGMAQALPQVVDHMTPGGTIPEDHGDQVSQVLAELERMRASRG